MTVLAQQDAVNITEGCSCVAAELYLCSTRRHHNRQYFSEQSNGISGGMQAVACLLYVLFPCCNSRQNEGGRQKLWAKSYGKKFTRLSIVTRALHESELRQIDLDRANVWQKPAHISANQAVLHVPCSTADVSEILSHSCKLEPGKANNFLKVQGKLYPFQCMQLN